MVEKMSGDVDMNMGMFMNMAINGLLCDIIC